MHGVVLLFLYGKLFVYPASPSQHISAVLYVGSPDIKSFPSAVRYYAYHWPLVISHNTVSGQPFFSQTS
jgi:hypothetical protein